MSTSGNQQFDEFWVDIEESRAKDPWLPWEVVCACFKGAQRIVVFTGGIVFKSCGGHDYKVPDAAGKSLIHYMEAEHKTPKLPRSKNGVPVIYVKER